MTDSIDYTSDFEVAWDVTKEDPSLYATLCEKTPAVAELRRSLEKRTPVARTVTPFEGTWYRPPFHNRAFYTACGGGFVSFKGTEPHARDLEERYVSMTRRRMHFSNFTSIERFPIEEHNVSVGSTIHETMAEALAALAIQRDWLARYGELAPLPFPIAVMRWPAALAEKFLAGQKPFMSKRAMEVSERLVATEGGLGGYIYFHPDPKPTRVLHLAGKLSGQLASAEDFPAREAALAAEGIDIGAFMDRYFRIAARLFSLGYFPGSMPFVKNGFSTDPQNVLTSAGIVDLGNCHLMREVSNDEFHQSWSLALLTLRRTTRALLTDTFMPFWGMHRDDDPLQSVVAGYVWEQFHQYMREEWKPETGDPRLTAILEQKTPIDGLRQLLRGLYCVPQAGGIGAEVKEMPLMYRQKR